MLGESLHADSLGQVLPDQAVGIFVGAALPGVMGSGEVKPQSDGALDRGVAVELGAVIGGDGVEPVGVALGQADRPVVELLRGAGPELADEEVAALALHQAHDAVLIAGPHDGIDLPVPDAPAVEHMRGTIGEVALAGEPAATVIGAVAFAKPSLVCPTQVLMQETATAPIVPDVPIDGLVADTQQLLPAQVAGNLFWTPLLAQQGLDTLQIVPGEALITP